jgi:hypothetical protein
MLAVVRIFPVNVQLPQLESNTMLLPPLYPSVGSNVVPIVVVVVDEVVDVVELDLEEVDEVEVMEVPELKAFAPPCFTFAVPTLAKFVWLEQIGLAQ